MNKKLITALVALTLALPITANAAPKVNLKSTSASVPTIAILDTAIDMSQPKFQNSVVHEVCLIEIFFDSKPRCPNGLTSMEGPGAATLAKNKLSVGGFDHGTLMADQALQTNPNVKIVFIRIIGQRESGVREYTNEATVYNALQWVINNQSKFNIQSVAMAQGSHALGAAGTDYCPKTPTTVEKVKALKKLITAAGAATLIEIDGGVTENNAAALVAAGADVLVAGTTVFKASDPKQMISTLKLAK